MDTPETRPSLLIRVRNPDDCEAWSEFTEIYRPLICRMARLKGLQHADADDLAQQVFLAVSRAVENWEPDAERARFRTWLKTIAHNAILNALRRNVPERASGRRTTRHFLDDYPASDGPDSALLRIEYRREVFTWAARKIRSEFSNDTWQAFWLTSIEAENIDKVARQLHRTRGSIYAARSRVMKRLRDQVEAFDDEAEARNHLPK